ncbi:hypothetical protein EMPG_12455 [Blastomyces silverae]|uniref:Uncharacterized protein n=1 Tax=Blastomyces silverae TaxID=2060906 RepID=A0A0H1BN30_9EURO|nr:hypothetical protein EMPG_12455 [Blastomyces silverae]
MAAVQASPKRGRVLSFTGSASNKSEKTHKSSGSHHKIKLSETHEEKEANRSRTHADPSRAIQELQPSAVALQKSNLESLRSVQHKDIYGNPIIDPDLSNPTRHRLERPLDTIRSFEAAIDGSYINRRGSFARPDESTNGGYSRRSSYFGDRGGGGAAAGGLSNHRNGGYNEQANYSAHRPAPSRPDSYAESYGGGNYNGYNNNTNNNNGYQPPRPPRHGGRMNQDQYAQGYNNNNGNSYFAQQQQQPPLPQYPQNDNYNYASASGSASDVVASYADPNHHASGDDDNYNHPYRQHQHQHQQQQQNQHQTPTETYGFAGFSDAPDLDYPQQSPHSAGGGGGYNHQNSTTGTDGYYADPSSNINSNNNNNSYNNNNGASQAIAGAPSVVRKPVAAFSSSSPAPAPAPTPPVEKRKSFFKRFSKS